MIAYHEVKVQDNSLDESKAHNWIDVEIKIREVDISNDDSPKLFHYYLFIK